MVLKVFLFTVNSRLSSTWNMLYRYLKKRRNSTRGTDNVPWTNNTLLTHLSIVRTIQNVMNNKKNVDIWYKEIVWIHFMYLKIGCYIKTHKTYNLWNSYIVYLFPKLKNWQPSFLWRLGFEKLIRLSIMKKIGLIFPMKKNDLIFLIFC